MNTKCWGILEKQKYLASPTWTEHVYLFYTPLNVWLEHFLQPKVAAIE